MSRGFLGQQARFALGLAAVERLDEDVAPLRIAGRLHEAERLAVFGEAEEGLGRVAEEVLHGVGRRYRRRRRSGCRLAKRGRHARSDHGGRRRDAGSDSNESHCLAPGFARTA